MLGFNSTATASHPLLDPCSENCANDDNIYTSARQATKLKVGTSNLHGTTGSCCALHRLIHGSSSAVRQPVLRSSQMHFFAVQHEKRICLRHKTSRRQMNELVAVRLNAGGYSVAGCFLNWCSGYVTLLLRPRGRVPLAIRY